MKEPMYSKLPHSHSPIGKDVELLIDFLTEIFASKKQEIIHADCDVGLIDLHLVRQPLWSVFSFPFNVPHQVDGRSTNPNTSFRMRSSCSGWSLPIP